jgi:hypothetical protein
MATGHVNCDKSYYPPGQTDHARRESPSSVTPFSYSYSYSYSS